MMVDMVPSSAKLVARARRMVAEIAGVPEDVASAAWDASGRNVKVAVLMLDGLSRADAEERLRLAGGRLDKARAEQVARV
jgi:N-acetylmuramic acid 6-phosphate etherase